MDEDYFKYKFDKYKEKYERLKSLLINQNSEKILNIKYTSLISSDDYYESEIKTVKDIPYSHYESKQFTSYYSSTNDDDLLNEIMKVNLEDLKDKMETENDNIFIEENFFNKNLLKKYIKLAKKNNYKINVTVLTKIKGSQQIINNNIINRIIGEY